MNYGKYIREARLLCGMKQRDLSFILSCNNAYVSGIETGRTRLSFNKANEILDLIGYELIDNPVLRKKNEN